MIRTRQRTDNLVITTFPERSADEGSPYYHEYCKISLRKYKVVDREQDLLTQGCNLQNPSNEDWINSWLAFKEENRESENWIIYRAIKNDDMYQMAPTGVKIKSIWVPSDDSGDEEETEED